MGQTHTLSPVTVRPAILRRRPGPHRTSLLQPSRLFQIIPTCLFRRRPVCFLSLSSTLQIQLEGSLSPIFSFPNSRWLHTDELPRCRSLRPRPNWTNPLTQTSPPDRRKRLPTVLQQRKPTGKKGKSQFTSRLLIDIWSNSRIVVSETQPAGVHVFISPDFGRPFC